MYVTELVLRSSVEHACIPFSISGIPWCSLLVPLRDISDNLALYISNMSKFIKIQIFDQHRFEGITSGARGKASYEGNR